MRKLLCPVFIIIISTTFNTYSYAWGEWGHEHINKAAIFTLPSSLQIFFFNHADYITYESVVPDIRKYTMADKTEFARHYINLEDYNYSSTSDMPVSLKEAAGRYGDSALSKSGILPWYIEVMMDKLTAAMKAGRTTEILFLAADLGHYIADAHMPLHTSANHDGQLTDQRGIHAFWESQLPELFGYKYNLHTANAHYINDISKEVWSIIEHCHSLADTLLATERDLKIEFKGKVYATDATGKPLKNKFNQSMYTKEYAQQYHKLLHGMVEKQMRLAIYELGCFWYTAWVNAGKPDMQKLDAATLTHGSSVALSAAYKAWLKGKVIDLKPYKEF